MDRVYLLDDKTVIVLTLPNTQETVTFVQIREFEMLSDDGSWFCLATTKKIF